MTNLLPYCCLLLFLTSIMFSPCESQRLELQGIREKMSLENERLLKQIAAKKPSVQKESAALDEYDDNNDPDIYDQAENKGKTDEKSEREKFQKDILVVLRENNNLMSTLIAETVQARKDTTDRMLQLVAATKLVVDVYNSSLGFDSVQHLFSVSASIKFLQKEIERVSWDRGSSAEKKVDQYYALMAEEIGLIHGKVSLLEQREQKEPEVFASQLQSVMIEEQTSSSTSKITVTNIISFFVMISGYLATK